jgi:putative oxidoreductase
MGKRLALLAIRLFVSVNLLYAAIFLKFAGVPGSVALFTQMSQAVHGLISQPVFRLGSGAFETVVAIMLLTPKTARLAAGLIVVWMTAVILSHIFVLGYGWFFVDAPIVMVLAVIYLLLARTHYHWGERESVGTTAALQRRALLRDWWPLYCGYWSSCSTAKASGASSVRSLRYRHESGE